MMCRRPAARMVIMLPKQLGTVRGIDLVIPYTTPQEGPVR